MKIPLFKPYFSKTCRKNIISDMECILESGQLMLGEFKDKFEGLMSRVVNMPYATSVNSCTTALTICLKYYDVVDHEILVPSGAFVTSVSSILFAGGTPVFVDMNPDTLSFDLKDLKRKITSKTKGIIWVHLTGFISPEYEEILKVAKDKKLFVIEDAAQALGAHICGKQAGSFGDAACFSFYPTKIITCGSGGMIITGNKALKNYAEEMRLFGKNAETGEINHIGNDWFLDEIHACIGYHHLEELEQNLIRRREIAVLYRNTLELQANLSLLKTPRGNYPSYYQFPIFLKKTIDRQTLMKTLKEEYGISTKGIYIPCHQEKIFRKYDDGTLSKTEETLDRSLCLPMHTRLSNEEAFYVTTSLIKELGK